MNQALCQHGLERLRFLHGEWQSRPTRGTAPPDEFESAQRLIRLACQVAEAADGSDAACWLQVQSDRYLEETKPQGRFDLACKCARSHVLEGTGGCGLESPFDPFAFPTITRKEAIFPDQPDIRRIDGTRIPDIVRFDFAKHPLPISHQLGIRQVRRRPRGIPKISIKEVCCDLEEILADLDIARLEFPVAVAALEVLDACLEVDQDIRSIKEVLWGNYREMLEANWRGAYLIRLCCQIPRDDPIRHLKVAGQLVRLMPACIVEVLKAAEELAARMGIGPVASTDAGEGGVPGDKKRGGPVPGDEANILVRDFLRKHPKATARDVADGIGIALGRVSKLPAWQAVTEERRKRSPKKSPRQLTRQIEASIGDADDPADQAGLDEACWSWLLEKAAPAERVSLRAMSPRKRGEMIEAVMPSFLEQQAGGRE